MRFTFISFFNRHLVSKSPKYFIKNIVKVIITKIRKVKIKMKKLISLLIVGVLILSIGYIGIGCKTADTETTTAADTETTTAADTETTTATTVAQYNPKKWDGTTITVAMDDRDQNEKMKKLVPEFTNATGINVKFVEIPELTLYEKTDIDLSSGTGLYDVIQEDDIKSAQFGPTGQLLSLNDFIKNPELINPDWFALENFPERFLAASNIEGQQYGIPFFCHTNFLHYRKDLFEQYNVKVPTTLAELTEAAKKLTLDTNNDGKTDIYGIALRGQRGATMNMWIYPLFLWSYGGKWFDDNWKPVFNNDAGIAALNKYVELMKNYAPEGSPNYGWVELQNALLEGKVAMVIDVELMGFLSEDSTISKVVGKMGHTYIPLTSGEQGFAADTGTNAIVAGGWCVTVNGASKNKEAAWQFVQWWTSNEIGKQCGYFSTKDALKTAYNAMPNPTGLESSYDIGQNLMAGANPNYRPFIAETNEVCDVISIAISDVLTSNKDAKTAFDEAAKSVEDILNKAGYYNK